VGLASQWPHVTDLYMGGMTHFTFRVRDWGSVRVGSGVDARAGDEVSYIPLAHTHTR